MPWAERAIGEKYVKALSGRFDKGEPVRIPLRNHHGKAALEPMILMIDVFCLKYENRSPVKPGAPPMPKMSIRGWFIVGVIVAASSGCGFESPDASSAGEDAVPHLTTVEQSLLSGYYLPFKAGTAHACSRGACGNPSGGGHCGDATFLKYNNYSFDWAMPRGTPLYASKGGTVQKTSTVCTSGMTCWNGGDAGCASGKENFVEIRIDGTNYVHAYGHMDSVAVQTGDVIKAGQYIGTSGMTGCAYGAHLHMGVRYQTSATADWYTVAFGYVESSGVPQCGTGISYTSQNSGAGPGEGRPWYWKTIQYADVNGDLKSDVCGRFSDGIYCGKSTSSGFDPVSLWTASFGNSGGWDNYEHKWGTIRFPDVTGDGKADVCGRGSAGIYCAISNGSDFVSTNLWIADFTDAGGWANHPSYWKTIQFPDVNGDGKADVCGRSSVGIQCAVSAGSAFTSMKTWTGSFGNDGGWYTNENEWATIRFPDLNGDGKADVCGRGGAGLYCALSNGNGFNGTSLWTDSFSNGTDSWDDHESHWRTIQYADLNNDGKEDVCGRGSGGIWCLRSTGSAFAYKALWTSRFGDDGGWGSTPSMWKTIQLADLNNDGRADVCGRGRSGIYCGTSSGTAFVSVTLWTDSFADENEWGDAPYYYETIKFPTSINSQNKLADVCGRAATGIWCLNSSGSAFVDKARWTERYSDTAGWGY
jgi:hypothetical protein